MGSVNLELRLLLTIQNIYLMEFLKFLNTWKKNYKVLILITETNLLI